LIGNEEDVAICGGVLNHLTALPLVQMISERAFTPGAAVDVRNDVVVLVQMAFAKKLLCWSAGHESDSEQPASKSAGSLSWSD